MKNGFFHILLSMFVSISTLILLIVIVIADQEVQANENQTLLFGRYVENTIPALSRGMSDSIRTEKQVHNSEEKSIFYEVFIANVYPTIDKNIKIISPEEQLGVKEEDISPEVKNQQKNDKKTTGEKNIVVSAELPKKVKMDLGKPVVLIYHTHGTESYIPYDSGNFHSIHEQGTVREVGENIKKTLESKGIKVIHDKSLYDSPSYNQSYARSLAATEKTLKENKSIQLIIDLHRDAADYKKIKAPTVEINGKDAAKFNLVLGNKNENYKQLNVFADYFNYKSDVMYPGFAGGNIEKDYMFNQYLSDYYLLLEVGDNENHIDEAKHAGIYLGHIIYEVIQDIQLN